MVTNRCCVFSVPWRVLVIAWRLGDMDAADLLGAGEVSAWCKNYLVAHSGLGPLSTRPERSNGLAAMTDQGQTEPFG
jgi:hypothetical protein